METATGNVSRVITKVQKRIQRTVSYNKYVATSAAIATRRAASRNKLFTSKGSHSVTAISPLNVNLCPIDKH
jgi:hypothetical protein